MLIFITDAVAGCGGRFTSSRNSILIMNNDTAAFKGGLNDNAAKLPPNRNGKSEVTQTTSPMNDNPAGKQELNEHVKCSTPPSSVYPGIVPVDEVPLIPEKVPADSCVPLDTENENTPSNSSAPVTGTPIPEMQTWLTDNREDYEFYLLHAMMHDPLKRISLISVPVIPDDFRREEYALVIGAIITASKILSVIGKTLPTPPTEEFLRTYVESASREEASDDDVVADAMKLVKELQDPSYKDEHYCISPYFEAWYGSVRAKKAAREFMKVDIPDVIGILENVHTALDAAKLIDGDFDDCEFDYDNIPEPPEPILKLGDHMISTPGNITNIQGPPKAAKSAVVGAAIAATLKQPWVSADTLGFTSNRLAGRAVVHFDTEQSAHAHDGLLRRAYLRANRREKASWLRSYCLTGMEPAMCWNVLVSKLKTAAEEHGGIMLVVIDGIADFCNDPNDAEECFGLVRKLHKLAGDYECVVLTVLHENPGSSFGKTRGHLGSQLERKAETSLRLKKDAKTGITVIWAESARHCFIPQGAGWRFQWCDNVKMHVSLREGGETDGGTKPDKEAKYAHEVAKVFRQDETLSYGDLTTRFTEVTGLVNSTARSRVPEYLAYELLEQDTDGKYRIIRAKCLEQVRAINLPLPLETNDQAQSTIPK